MKREFAAPLTSFALLAAALAVAFLIKMPEALPVSAEAPETAETVPDEATLVEPPDAIVFDPPGYIFREPVTVKLTATQLDGMEVKGIYYTLDGTDPTARSKRYSEDGIPLEGARRVAGYSVTARALYSDGSWSAPVVKSYFVGSMANIRFNTLIFSITGDPDGFFGYENGILIAGKRRDDYVAANPRVEIKPPSPANWNFPGMTGERKAHIEILSPDGTLLEEQNIGVRVHGGWSRAKAQKSLRLISRSIYGDTRFRCSLFTEPNARAEDGTLISTYKRLTLRNNANDSGSANMRDELIQLLARDAGFPDTQSAAPAAVYLNGEYYGFEWLKETYDKEYFDEHYECLRDGYTGEFVILEGGDRKRNVPSGEGLNYQKGYYEYEKLYRYSEKDLTKDKYFDELSALLDIENYLKYFAIQLYVGNTDWPQNNNKIYRYYAGEGESYDADGVFDGRWRQLLFDTDFGLGGSGTNVKTESLARLYDPGNNGYSPLFIALMKRDDCREYYIRQTYELMYGAFAAEHAADVITSLSVARYNEIETYMSQCKYSPKMSMDSLGKAVKTVRSVISGRPAFMKQELVRKLRISGREFSFTVTPAGEGGFYLGDFHSFEELTGAYPVEYGVTLTASPAVGETFSHWLINGEAVYSESVTLDASMAARGKITAEVVLADGPETPLPVLYEVSTKGENDYFLLINPYKTALRTAGLSVSDDPGEPLKYILPVVTIEPGETLKILCSNNEGKDALRHSRATFSLRDGETLRLYSMKELISEVKLPKLSEESVYRLDIIDGKYYEQLVSTESDT